MRHTLRGAMGLALIVLAATGRGETVVGDWGHFVANHPRVLLNNPDGRAFTVTINVMRWPVESWNPASIQARLTGPDGAVTFDGAQALEHAACERGVPAGAPGVYRLEAEGQPLWVKSSLDQAVL